MEPNSLKAGYLIFNDEDCGITFRQCDAMQDGVLEDWNGQFSMITGNYIWHVFSLDQQEKFGDVLIRLMTGKPNNLVFGRLLVTKTEARKETGYPDAPYLHTQDSFTQLWERIAARANRQVKVEMQPGDEIDLKVVGVEKPLFALYSVRLD